MSEEELKLKVSEFKVGWSYQSNYGENFLIHHIWNDNRNCPMIASPIDPGSHFDDINFKLSGVSSPYNVELILSTGKKWEPEE